MSEQTADNSIVHYFQTRIPAMLDGAVLRGDDHGRLVRRADLAFRKGRMRPERLPADILRETLDAVAAVATPAPKTMAGAVPVSPHDAWVWWDKRVLENLEDVLSRLDSPRLVLRFYDVTGLEPEAGETGRRHETFDLDVELREEGKTVHFWSSDRSYIVDLGYTHADGRFLRLARTNVITLPRDAKGELRPDETATSRLAPAADKKAPYTAPDAAAREWAALRPDSETRDAEAELTVHMLYRAFLLEGPRALRRAPALVRRDLETLRQDFARRRQRAAATTAKPAQSATAPALLVQRLDAAPARTAAAAALFTANLPVVAAVAAAVVVVPEKINRVTAEPYISVAGAEIPAALFATPVFEAAKDLRERLAGFRSPDRDRAAAIAAADAASLFDAAEAKRFAKAGVRVSKVSLTLEGKIRPGARLKVAGKLVHADEDGHFRLECTLSGRRTAIPMRAGTSIAGEARSLISIDWSQAALTKV